MSIEQENLGASDAVITTAERALAVRFPEELKSVWRVSNGLKLPGGWVLFPVFDPDQPRKTCSHIGYENTKVRWSTMSDELISIASGMTGNQLVLHRSGDSLEGPILCWDHETGRTRKWPRDFVYLLSMAQARAVKIRQQIARSLKRSKPG